jgi:predicted membrane protein
LSPPDDAQDNNNNENLVLDFSNNEQYIRQSSQLATNVLFLDTSIKCFEIYYENLAKVLLDETRELKPEIVQIFRVSTKILIQIQMFQNKKENIEKTPEWFNAITDGIKVAQPQINLIAIDAMIEILISEKKDPIYE